MNLSLSQHRRLSFYLTGAPGCDPAVSVHREAQVQGRAKGCSVTLLSAPIWVTYRGWVVAVSLGRGSSSSRGELRVSSSLYTLLAM